MITETYYVQSVNTTQGPNGTTQTISVGPTNPKPATGTTMITGSFATLTLTVPSDQQNTFSYAQEVTLTLAPVAAATT